MSRSVILKMRVQPALVVAKRASDPEDWVFTLCKRGMEQLLGRTLHVDEELYVRFTGSELKDQDNGQ